MHSPVRDLTVTALGPFTAINLGNVETRNQG
jgi:hypothetical protein